MESLCIRYQLISQYIRIRGLGDEGTMPKIIHLNAIFVNYLPKHASYLARVVVHIRRLHRRIAWFAILMAKFAEDCHVAPQESDRVAPNVYDYPSRVTFRDRVSRQFVSALIYFFFLFSQCSNVIPAWRKISATSSLDISPRCGLGICNLKSPLTINICRPPE